MNAIGKIGVILPAIKSKLDSEFLQGVYDHASMLGYDVLVFTNVSNAQSDFLPNEYVDGENNIYTLLEEVQLDGIIFAAGKFASKKIIAEIYEILKKINTPCLSIEDPQDDFPYLYAPQRAAIRKITEHLIQEHHYKKIYCLTGPEDSFCAKERLMGFRETVAAADFSDENSQVFYGDFWKNSAAELGDKIASGEIPMPEAVVCTNDIMAISLCESLQAHGIDVPEQIAITGYDGNVLASTHFPTITTISGIEYHLGQCAVSEIYRLITGNTSHAAIADYLLQLGSSCGCCQNNAEQLLKNNRLLSILLEQMDIQEVYMASNYIIKISEADTLEDFKKAVDSLAHLLPNWKWLDICLCEDWMRDVNNPQNYRQQGYSKQMLLLLSKRFGCANEDNSYLFKTKDLLPALDKAHTPKLIILTPLHYVKQVFGYCATSYESAFDYQAGYYYNNWCDTFSNGLRALQEKLYIKEVQKQMKMYSSKDQSTGMYNKNGLIDRIGDFFGNLSGSDRAGILLLISYHYMQISQLMNEQEFPLLLANIVQLSCRLGELTARINEKTYAIMIPLKSDSTLPEQVDAWMIHFEKLMKTTQPNAACFPQFITDYSVIHFAQLPMFEQILEERLHILNEKTKSADHTLTDYSEQLIQLRREMRINPQYNYEVSDAASSIGISTSYFQRLYSRQFGCSFSEDLAAARLKKAKELLKTTNLRVQEITELSGYQNSSNFMRQFKKKVGMTALEYRKTHRK